MAVDSNAIANAALQQIGGNAPQVTGQNPTWDDSAAGVALQKLYTFCVQTVGRQFGWDFARNLFTLQQTANTPPPGWAYEYLYPGVVEVWQLVPPTIADPNNPTPITWNVGNALVSSVQTKVIWSNLQNANAYYNNNPSEAVWDPLFREAVIRLLGSELSIALNGRPDTAEGLLNSGGAFESIGEMRPD